MQIQQAVLQDIPVITEIYNHAVAYTTAIWNEEIASIENREQWFLTKKKDGFPVLVAYDEVNKNIMGYATYGAWRNFDGYKFTVEHSIYVHPNHQQKGVGQALLFSLIEHAKKDQKRVMVASIESKNTASIRLHEKFGFKTVGIFKHVGFKFNKWLDLTCLELDLQA